MTIYSQETGFGNRRGSFSYCSHHEHVGLNCRQNAAGRDHLVRSSFGKTLKYIFKYIEKTNRINDIDDVFSSCVNFLQIRVLRNKLHTFVVNHKNMLILYSEFVLSELI
jgi:hypothetical protein